MVEVAEAEVAALEVEVGVPLTDRRGEGDGREDAVCKEAVPLSVTQDVAEAVPPALTVAVGDGERAAEGDMLIVSAQAIEGEARGLGEEVAVPPPPPPPPAAPLLGEAGEVALAVVLAV